MKYKNKNKGITLITLVITIIILLILAGVTIAELTGNGLFDKVKLAKERAEQAQKEEDERLKQYEELMNGNLPENTPDTEAGTKVKLKAGWGDTTVRYIKTPSGDEITELDEVATVYAVSVGDGNVVPVPKGFFYVGGTLDTGVIISDNKNDEYNAGEDKTTWEYTTKLVGNQFVWIPCTEEEYTKTNYSMQNANWDNTTPESELTQIQKYGGFYVGRYEAGLAADIEETKENQDHTSAGLNQIYNKDGMPQSKAGVIPWMFINWNKSKANAEKMYIDSKYVNSGLITGTQWDVMLKTLVEKTDLEESDLINSSRWGNYCDNQITYTGRLATATYSGNSKWILEPFSEEVKKQGTTASYSDYEGGNLLTTGASKIAGRYNIYDVAGNLWEWTEEASFYGGDTATQYRVFRGGCFVEGSDPCSACYRYGFYAASSSVISIGFRVVLYIK